MLMSKPVYLGLSILELSKILMYEFWYDYVKPKYGKKKTKLCYTDTVAVGYVAHFPAQVQKNPEKQQKKSTRKSLSLENKKNPPQENFLYFSQKKAVLMFQEKEISQKFLIFQETFIF